MRRRILMQILSHSYIVLLSLFIFVQKGYLVTLQSTFCRCAQAYAHVHCHPMSTAEGHPFLEHAMSDHNGKIKPSHPYLVS